MKLSQERLIGKFNPNDSSKRALDYLYSTLKTILAVISRAANSKHFQSNSSYNKDTSLFSIDLRISNASGFCFLCSVCFKKHHSFIKTPPVKFSGWSFKVTTYGVSSTKKSSSKLDVKIA